MPDSENDIHAANEDELFQRAFDSLLGTEKKGYPSFVGGMMVASGNDYELTSPIDRSIIFGNFQMPEKGTVAAAVGAAGSAVGNWSSKTSQERTELFRDVLKRVRAQRYRLAACVMISTGMVMKDCLAEADRLAEVIGNAFDADFDKGSPSGVWGVVSGHNSPLASPAGFSSCAMMAGNTVVSVPSKDCPMPMFMFNSILSAAGLPVGVFNITVARGPESDRELVDDMTVRGLAASGSGERAEELIFLPVDDGLRFINEIKGMNPIMIYRPGDMKGAASSIVESAFRSSGQRIYSCSKVIVTNEERDKAVSAILDAAKTIKVGDPAEQGTTAGPLMNETELMRFEKYIEEAGSSVAFGGRRVKGPGLENGSYVMPAVVVGLTDDCELGSFDTGLPILTIVSAPNFDDAMEELMNTECGPSASIFSKDSNAVAKFKEYADAPRINVNKGTEDLLPAMDAEVRNFLA
ncbi:MAG: aldehyde dehydrogenase family protein [Candidatus Methanomethylophilaceae archaeon]|jgi:acyl-CoA reductase-like NAD-dependent aldehyde dehydrogenase|nr:aldehyde dehydrogenase family protein [Candidatus Methanomethylophilaceae archaeon]NCA73236.1 aldehyde dehydrogenase family protein [Gammaproteobacteria bacterium]MDD2936365.1 aldehyde dehydrogenase family protein [Candidatus Methanomethylophilaceae archaeon]MDD3350886.1 aldehyde dehydrogenase family protein [Candidatus Methanomethylophilaceae archaeon]MDD3986626.1 aldehyde dehydrogenase family protein [Candidatus Methanomethylophilaceae archaeon]